MILPSPCEGKELLCRRGNGMERSGFAERGDDQRGFGKAWTSVVTAWCRDNAKRTGKARKRQAEQWRSPGLRGNGKGADGKAL